MTSEARGFRQNTSRFLSPFITSLFSIAMLLALSLETASPQQTSLPPATLSDFQTWDELDISARITPSFDVAWVTQGRLSDRFPNPATYLSGLDFKFNTGSHLVLTPSYYYLGFTTPAGQKGHFHIPMLSATLQKRWERWSLSDRNRFLDALNGGQHIAIYMNRPKLDYQLPRSQWHTSLFIADETFYFWTFHGWTRNRLSAGTRKEVNKRLAADLYYLRQDDTRLQPRTINSIDVSIELRVR